MDAIDRNLGRIRLALERKRLGIPSERNLPPSGPSITVEHQGQGPFIPSEANSYGRHPGGVGQSVVGGDKQGGAPGVTDQGIWQRLRGRFGL